MSADIVDDLHAAEATIASLTDRIHTALRRLEREPLFGDSRVKLIEVLSRAMADGIGFCRPSCQWVEAGECQAEDPDDCGCYCNHGEDDEYDRARPGR